MSQEIVSRNPFLPVRVPADTLTRHESVEQLLYVLFRRKWLIVGLFLSFTIAAGIAMWSRAPVRSAVAKILLKPDRVSLQISELAPHNKVTYSAELLKSELELVMSRDVMIPVAKRLLSDGRDPESIAAAELDEKVGELSGNLVTSTVGASSVMRLEYFAPTTEQAERTLGLIVDQYLEHHAVAYSGSTQLLSFYEKEKERAATALTEAEERQREWQQRNDVVSIDDQIMAVLSQRSSQERELQTTDTGMQVALQDNALLNRLEGDLVTARVELNDLLARYTARDRRVQEKRAQMALIQDQLAAARGALVSSVAKRKDAVRQQIQQSSAALQDLREKRLEGGRLARAVDVSRDAFLLYGKKLEEARISHQLNREQLSNVAVIERPHPTDWTDSEERFGTTVLASIVGLTLGIAVAFALAFFNKSVRTRRDVEVYLGVPVLATIPQLGGAAIPDLRRNS